MHPKKLKTANCAAIWMSGPVEQVSSRGVEDASSPAKFDDASRHGGIKCLRFR
jgi:hypothetical protein